MRASIIQSGSYYAMKRLSNFLESVTYIVHTSICAQLLKFIKEFINILKVKFQKFYEFWGLSEKLGIRKCQIVFIVVVITGQNLVCVSLSCCLELLYSFK